MLFHQAFNKLLHLKTDYFTDRNGSEIVSSVAMDVGNVASVTDRYNVMTIGFIFRVISGLVGLMGTANWHEVKVLAPIVKKLTDNDVNIVAAYNNMNIPSWPAYLPGVFGVRHDRSGALECGEILFDRADGMNDENAIVANYGKSILLKGETERPATQANSFAAPVITARILRMLDENNATTFQQALDILRAEAITGANTYPSLFRNYELWKDMEVETPVVCVSTDCPEALKGMYKLFMANGYAVEGFVGNDSGFVPLCFYLDACALEEGLPFLLEKIYKTDVMLFEITQKEIDWKQIDAYIERKGDGYLLRVEEWMKELATPQGVFQELIGYFNP